MLQGSEMDRSSGAPWAKGWRKLRISASLLTGVGVMLVSAGYFFWHVLGAAYSVPQLQSAMVWVLLGSAVAFVVGLGNLVKADAVSVAQSIPPFLLCMTIILLAANACIVLGTLPQREPVRPAVLARQSPCVRQRLGQVDNQKVITRKRLQAAQRYCAQAPERALERLQVGHPQQLIQAQQAALRQAN